MVAAVSTPTGPDCSGAVADAKATRAGRNSAAVDALDLTPPPLGAELATVPSGLKRRSWPAEVPRLAAESAKASNVRGKLIPLSVGGEKAQKPQVADPC